MFVKKTEFNFDILTSSIKKAFSHRDFNIEHFKISINDALNQLEVFIWKKNVGKIEEFEKTHVPKTWKDHFKKKHRFKKWMKWWIKRKPIEYFHIERITVFPDVKIPPNMNEFKHKISYSEVVPIYEP